MATPRVSRGAVDGYTKGKLRSSGGFTPRVRRGAVDGYTTGEPRSSGWLTPRVSRGAVDGYSKGEPRSSGGLLNTFKLPLYISAHDLPLLTVPCTYNVHCISQSCCYC